MVKKAKWYPADDEKKHFKRKSKKPEGPRDRAGFEPGAICIVLAGRFQGRRVIFLRMLASGLALVTGPYKINGVPLRRMNPVYLLVTKTKIDLPGHEYREVEDAFFAKAKEAKKGEEEKFFAEPGATVLFILS
eukprot:TRINITY_DN752_c0_g1_i8.p3 TRINITY_DN752_c0_g1~~TRINITY_DN752_c0_g1_i8.p3  ORF type:complete len:133 (+),score=27.28 TRINITY_DN752_c0_g1_i8:134-532(+)